MPNRTRDARVHAQRRGRRRDVDVDDDGGEDSVIVRRSRRRARPDEGTASSIRVVSQRANQKGNYVVVPATSRRDSMLDLSLEE
jgi:hypothetical protein